MTIKVTYNVTDIYVTQDVSPVYINVSYSSGGGGGAAVWGGITGTLSDQTDLQTALDLKVPYTGATQDVSLGEYGINVGNLIYDTTPTGIPTDQGATYWDDQAETVALVMNGTIQKIGEDTFYHVKNSTGSTIAKGVAVRFAGTDGGSGKILIAPFLANGTYPSQYYMGITAEAITNGSNGKVYHFGKIRGVNTSAFADGDILYCSTTSAGGFQTTAPSAPNNIVVAAAVINAANNGTLMVRTTTGSNINTDEGVLLTTPTSGQVLKYNGSLWVNDSVSGALGYTPANAATTLTINGVTFDLSANRTFTVGSVTGSGASGQVAYWSGTSAQAGSNNLFWDATNNRLGIGVSTPSRPLSVTFNANNGDGLLYLNNPNTGSSANAGLVFEATTALGSLFATSSTYTTVGVLQANRVGFYANNTFAVAVQNGDYVIGTGSTLVEKLRLFGNTGNVLIQNGGTFTDSGERLQVTGTMKVTGNVAVDTNTLFVDTTNKRIGVRTATPGASVDIWNNSTSENAQLRISHSSLNIPNYSSVGFFPLVSTTTVGFYGLSSSSVGGVQFSGFTNATATATPFFFVGYHGSTSPTVPALRFIGFKHDGSTNRTALTGNEIIAGFSAGLNADVFQVKANGRINMSSLPTSSTGLATGDLWNDAGTIKIV